MKSKNDKTNPFPGRVTFSGTASDLNAGADRRSAAHKMLSLAINTAQKNIRFTTDLTKLGTLKNEETNPTFQPRSAPYHAIAQSLATTVLPPMKRPIFMIFQDDKFCRKPTERDVAPHPSSCSSSCNIFCAWSYEE